ncbi:glycosyl transferase [Effusibacillus dendaii]|uniref:Glycosyl transferase n=1 Tax=Effusibacillus dendaii TaxID=2743772 RepID=A0A7I8D6G1_9BACL|nr:glycosyl transferase [Effusibacillus dendaii]BCJ85675.1 glycosyl transferase [Effusibacillus dendaii]
MYRSPVSFRHLQRMTDDTGLLEHCLGKIPRRAEGYTTDDNARALWACVEWWSLLESEGAKKELQDKLLELIERYLSFLLWVQRDDGTFHNNIRFDRTPEPEQPSDDCLGRTIWSCAVAYAKLTDPDLQIAVQEMLRKAIPATKQMMFPRGWAYALAACSLLLQHAQKSPSHAQDRFSQWVVFDLPERVGMLEEQLVDLYRQQAGEGWHWFEPAITYGNGVLPWGLFYAYSVTHRQDTLDIAKESLDFLIEKMTGNQGRISPIGNQGWCTREQRSNWDQQPLDVMKLALASAQAYITLKQSEYWEIVKKCHAWFYGDNDLSIPLAETADGSCCDGLRENGANRNRGAESTLSYLLTEAIWQTIEWEDDVHDCRNRQQNQDSFTCVQRI